jgi:hypothetical protein
MKGLTPLFTCEHADLVVKIDYDSFSSESVTLSVTDAESGDAVFRDERGVSDLSSDLIPFTATDRRLMLLIWAPFADMA